MTTPKSIWQVPHDEPDTALEVALFGADEQICNSLEAFKEHMGPMLFDEFEWRDRLLKALYSAREGDAKEVLALLSNAIARASSRMAAPLFNEWDRCRGKRPVRADDL